MSNAAADGLKSTHVSSIEAILAKADELGLDEATKAEFQRLKLAEAKKRAKHRECVQKYPHAIKETLRYDESAKKNKVRIKCVSCGDTSRWVYTSDLFQVKHCKDCRSKVRAAIKREKAELQKKALEAYEAALKNKKQS